MSEHVLSQDEIDALLRADADAGEPTMLDMEPLVQLFEAVLEHMAPVVSPVAGQQFGTGRVVAELLPWEELRGQFITPLFARIDFEGDLTGMQLSIADGSTQQQLRAMSEAEPVTVLNKMVLALAAGLEKQLDVQFQTEITSFEPLDDAHDSRIPLRSSDMCVVLHVSLQGESGDVAWREVLPRDVADEILDRLHPQTTSEAQDDGVGAAKVAQQQVAAASAAPAAAPASAGSAATTPVPVAPAQFGALGEGGLVGESANIGLIMDVPLQVTVELGRKRMLVRDVLELGKGSLIELEKLAGEPVDVFVNDKLIAKGEVVVIDENFGVKVTSIVTPVERLQNLQ